MNKYKKAKKAEVKVLEAELAKEEEVSSNSM